MGKLDTIIPLRNALPPGLDQIARTPIFRGKRRNYQILTFPDLVLNPQDYNSVVMKFPSNAIFCVRQIHFAHDYAVTGFGTTPIGKSRLSVSSTFRPNQAFSNDLITMENTGESFLGRIPHMLYFPCPIQPGSFMTYEGQNLDSSAHTFKMALEGEYLYNPDASTLKFFSTYSWFQYVAPSVTVDATALPTSFTEIRTHPDSDFYITNILASAIPPNDDASGPSAAATGPIFTKIYLGSQAEPIMDAPINNVNLMGAYSPQQVSNYSSLLDHASMPFIFNYPIRVPAGESVFIQSTASFATSPVAYELVLEGIKVFI